MSREIIAADDMGASKQPALQPIFKKVAPMLVNQFQKGLKALPPATRKRAIKTYFKDVKLTGDASSKKNHKMLRDILVKALVRDRGWLEFVAEQILDGSANELKDVLTPTKTAGTTAGMRTSAHMQPQYTNTTMYVVETNDGDVMYPADDFTVEQVCADLDCSPADVTTETGWFTRLTDPAYMDATDWEGPFASENAAMQHIKDAHDVDPETGDSLEVDASVKTAGVVDAIFEGKYPDSDDLADVEFPVRFKTLGQSDTWSRLRAVADAEGFTDGMDIVLEDADDAAVLFDALNSEADAWAEEAEEQMRSDYAEFGANDADDQDEDDYEHSHEAEWFEQNYNDYMSEQHDPAYILAQQLGLH